jgi:hypothetical protein
MKKNRIFVSVGIILSVFFFFEFSRKKNKKRICFGWMNDDDICNKGRRGNKNPVCRYIYKKKFGHLREQKKYILMLE